MVRCLHRGSVQYMVGGVHRGKVQYMVGVHSGRVQYMVGACIGGGCIGATWERDVTHGEDAANWADAGHGG